MEVGRLKEAMLLIRSEILTLSSAPRTKFGEQKESSIQDGDNYTSDDSNYDDNSRSGHLDTSANGPRVKRPAVCFDIMKKLAQAVKKEENPELSGELTLICDALDHRATLVEKSLEEIVFEPIRKLSLIHI